MLPAQLTAPKTISQSKAAFDFASYIDKRRRGEIPLYKTCYKNLNKVFGGSIEPNTILTIAGMSGTGKSAMSKRIIYSITENLQEKKQKCITLCFNYEMLAFRTVAREVAKAAKMSLSKIYSSDEENPLSENEYHYLLKHTKKLKDYNIHYIEKPDTHDGIHRAILDFWEVHCANDLEKLLIVEIDHTLLIKGNGNINEEKQKLDKLAEDMVSIKKEISDKGGRILIIFINQLNRNIENVERLKNPLTHRPGKSDIAQSDNIYQASDYVLIGHNPSKLHLPFYTELELPTIIYSDPVKRIPLPFIYYHLLKNRDGEGNTFCCMVGNLAYFDFIEVSGEDLDSYVEKRKSSILYLNTQTKLDTQNG